LFIQVHLGAKFTAKVQISRDLPNSRGSLGTWLQHAKIQEGIYLDKMAELPGLRTPSMS